MIGQFSYLLLVTLVVLLDAQEDQESAVDKSGDAQNRNRAGGSRNLQFPLPQCYVNADGFMCCNKELEQLMDSTYKNLSQSRNGKWKKCNIHQVAVAIQKNAQDKFGVDFEAVVGAGDYASKNYFSQDLICKIKRDTSFIMAFGSPLNA
ncbi:ground-like domain-containing protein [Ditylenchus destructor]|uniref:Ground-like domain-containing protein n=1 Tax=Ditylenchus destructor TaxID=166010 RepID=A0AAD4NEZ3_9BILA|nr:ground-like domain-containing protein [Ditylenchus destructor]